MSSESSASETTPLRRPESQSSDDVVLRLPSITHNAVRASGSLSAHHGRNSSSTSNQVAVALPSTVSVSKHNNNNIEVRLGQNLGNSNISSSSANSGNHGGNTQSEMDTNKRILCRVGLDVLILLCVGIPVLIFFLIGDSFKRGFFCDDESLKHPYKDSTVRNWMLYIIGIGIPICVIIPTEIFRAKHNARMSNGNTTTRRYVFMNYEIPAWLLECYKTLGVFAFGALVSQLTTDIAKYSIGRLRPHFFTVCQPKLNDGTTCDDPVNVGKYIEDYYCEGFGSTPRMLKEAHLSFPSGHSSFTFFTMVYLALYLQARMTWRGSKLLKHFLQFLFIMIAWYTALSRVSDYKHHWSDVLAGSTIGIVTAIVVAKYISDLFQNNSAKTYVLPCTNQDALSSAHTVTTNGH